MIEVAWTLEHPELLIGLVQAETVQVAPSDDRLAESVREAVVRTREGNGPAEEVRVAIRDLLRRGGFKPTGRSKPASEYLVKAAVNDAFPAINNLVDINNLVSLQSGWPCSVLDLDLACPRGDESLEVRFGRKEERYIFNPAGQSIDVAGLVCLARSGGEPIANAVKDSMATKTRETTSRVLFVTYASRRVSDEDAVRAFCDRVAELLRDCTGAQQTEVKTLSE